MKVNCEKEKEALTVKEVYHGKIFAAGQKDSIPYAKCYQVTQTDTPSTWQIKKKSSTL